MLPGVATASRSAAQDALGQASPKSILPRLVEASSKLPIEVRDSVLAIANSDAVVPTHTLTATANVVVSHVGEVGSVVMSQHAPIPALRTSLGAIAVAATSPSAFSEIAPLAVSAWIRALARVAELRDALTELRNIGDDNAALDVRRILVAETLDLGSHRLDAWLDGNRRAASRIVARVEAQRRDRRRLRLGRESPAQRRAGSEPRRRVHSRAESRACEHGGAAPKRVSHAQS